jgi:hypothetical protein
VLVPRGNRAQPRASSAAAEAGGLCLWGTRTRECWAPGLAALRGEGSGPTQSSEGLIRTACTTEWKATQGTNGGRLPVFVIGVRSVVGRIALLPNLGRNLSGSRLPMLGL